MFKGESIRHHHRKASKALTLREGQRSVYNAQTCPFWRHIHEVLAVMYSVRSRSNPVENIGVVGWPLTARLRLKLEPTKRTSISVPFNLGPTLTLQCLARSIWLDRARNAAALNISSENSQRRQFLSTIIACDNTRNRTQLAR
jgi:hypothetical protein